MNFISGIANGLSDMFTSLKQTTTYSEEIKKKKKTKSHFLLIKDVIYSRKTKDRMLQ